MVESVDNSSMTNWSEGTLRLELFKAAVNKMIELDMTNLVTITASNRGTSAKMMTLLILVL